MAAMTSCAELLPTLFEKGQESALLLASNTLASACVQAAATARAGIEAAKAARDAGHWTAAAGFMTVVAGTLAYFAARHTSRAALKAAHIAAAAGMSGIRESALAQQQEAEKARLFALKREVFEGVVEATFSATVSISRVGSIDVPIGHAMNHAQTGVSKLAKLHLVTDPSTLESVLAAHNDIIKHRNIVLLERVRIERLKKPLPSSASICLADLSMRETIACVPSVVRAIVSLREQLGLDIDAARYEDTMAKMSELTGEHTKAFLGAIFKDFRTEAASPP